MFKKLFNNKICFIIALSAVFCSSVKAELSFMDLPQELQEYILNLTSDKDIVGSRLISKHFEELAYQTLLRQLQNKINGLTHDLRGIEKENLANAINGTLFDLTGALAFVPTGSHDRLYRLPSSLKQRLYKGIESNLTEYYQELILSLGSIRTLEGAADVLSKAGLKKTSEINVLDISRLVEEHQGKCPVVCALSVYLRVAKPFNCQEYCVYKNDQPFNVPAFLLKQVFTYYDGLDFDNLIDIGHQSLNQKCNSACYETFVKALLTNPCLPRSTQPKIVSMLAPTFSEEGDYCGMVNTIEELIKSRPKNSKDFNFELFDHWIRDVCPLNKEGDLPHAEFRDNVKLYQLLAEQSGDYQKSIVCILDVIGESDERVWRGFDYSESELSQLYVQAIDVVSSITKEGLRIRMLERIITSITAQCDILKVRDYEFFQRVWGVHEYNPASGPFEKGCHFCMPHICMGALIGEVSKITDRRAQCNLLFGTVLMLNEYRCFDEEIVRKIRKVIENIDGEHLTAGLKSIWNEYHESFRRLQRCKRDSEEMEKEPENKEGINASKEKGGASAKRPKPSSDEQNLMD